MLHVPASSSFPDQLEPRFPATTEAEDAQAWFALGKRHFELGELEQAGLAFHMAGELTPNDARVFRHLGLVHQQLHENDSAEAFFHHALELGPEDIRALKLFGAFLMDRDRHVEARPHFANVLSHQPDDLEALLQLGICCFKVRNFDVARVCCQRVLKLCPGHPLAVEQLAKLNAATASLAD